MKEDHRVLEEVVVDAGVADKRLLLFEPEFATVLRRMRGETNSTSSVLREAWESGSLSTLTKNSPMLATGAHVSMIAHSTREELVGTLTETDRANGFADRFMCALVRRAQCLPEPEPIAEAVLDPLITELRQVIAVARVEKHRMTRDADARALWAEVYPRLSEGEPGLLGALLARAEAHVLRLSVLYAVLDRSPVIKPVHLKAALAVWDYIEASTRQIFGRGPLGVPVADAILEALRTKTKREMTRTAISDLFHGNRTAAEIDAALMLLAARGAIVRPPNEAQAGQGPPEVWRLA